MLKKPLAFALAVSLFASSLSPTVLFAVQTNNSSTPWTMEKAEHLARKVYFAATPERTSALYQAWSASAAAEIVFPDQNWPSRTVYDSEISTLTSSGFNWWDATSMNRLYNFRYARDPYESKAKLFSLFEDIFPVNQSDKISYRDIIDQHNLLYSHALGNYRTMVKRVLYNNGQPGDYAMGKFLDLLDQSNKNSPNENYARELLQLFLMGEYKPGESKDAGNVRNYEEEDVAALACVLTGYVSDPLSHAVSYDGSKHNTSTGVLFLSGALKAGASFPFVNASGALDLWMMVTSSWLGDSTIDYIFAKREDAIALFLADRIYRFYAHGNPSRQELDMLAAQILVNDFELLPTVRWFISSDMMYSDAAMNGVTYKNPLELAIGTVKLLHRNSPTVIDPLLRDSNLLSRFNWTPYFPGSVFWRDGFDDNAKFYSSYIQNQWISFSSRVAFDTQSGSYLFSELVPYTRLAMTWSVDVSTSTGNTYSGSLTVVSWSVNLVLPIASDASVSLAAGEDIITDTGSTSTPPSESVITTDSWTSSGSISTGETSSWATEPLSSTGSSEVLPTTGSGEALPTTGSWEEVLLTTWSGEVLPATGSGEVSSTGALEFTIASTGSIEEDLPQGQVFSAAISQSETYLPLELSLPAQVTLPKFSLSTSTGELVIYSWAYDTSLQTLTISSGAVLRWTGSIWIKPWSTLSFDPATASLSRDITPDELVSMLESQLLLGRKVPTSVRDSFKQFLLTGNDGSSISFRPSLSSYQTSKIRSLISLILVQPEYVLATGYDAPSTIENISQSVLSNASGKLVFVELWGGYDWLHGVIPKSEYSEYVSKRTLTWGTIAIDEAHLVDIGDFYLNRALAYGSGWTEPSLKSLFDSNNLRIFNRVGTLKHSRDHDQAQKQIASYASTTADDADWVFGQLVKSEPYSENTISLSGKRPNVFRWGRYINIGPSWAIFSNQYLNTADRTAHLNAMRDILKNRSYPGGSGDAFKAAVRVDEIAQISKNSGGPDGAGYGNLNNLKFLKTLMTNNVGKSFYIQADGGYDTHSNQLAPQSNFDPMNIPKDLNYNIGRVVSNLTSFFNEMKSTQDLTIVVFSEFWRTIKTNGDLGTDHGQGGGMFVISNNQNLLSSLNQKVYGNISVTKARQDWLGVGIDYRSVYGKIYKALYWLPDTTYFWAENDLLKDIDTTPAKIALSSYEYRSNNDSNVRLSVRFKVESDNFNSDKAWYVKASRPKNANDLNSVMEGINSWEMDNYVRKPNGVYDFSRDWINEKRQYRLDYSVITNQYAETLRSVSPTIPEVIAANALPIVSGTGNLIFRRFDNTLVESSGTTLAWSWIVLANIPLITYALTGSSLSGTGSSSGASLSGTTSTGASMLTWTIIGEPVTIRSSQGIEITASWAWITSITSVVSSSGWLRWHGGFVIGDIIDSTNFISRVAQLFSTGGTSSVSLSGLPIHTIVKIWADTLWVGMRLNRSVQVGIPSTPWAEYQVITTEDGLNWSFVGNGEKYRAGSDGMVRFNTQAFSYFALIPPQAVVLPPTNPGSGGWSVWGGGWSSGGSTGGGGTDTSWGGTSGGGSSNVWTWSNGWAPVATWWGGGGGSSLSVFAPDSCPNGDMTSSKYDGKCGTSVSTPVMEPGTSVSESTMKILKKDDSTFVVQIRVPNTGVRKPMPKKSIKPRILRISPETLSKIRVPNTGVRRK